MVKMLRIEDPKVTQEQEKVQRGGFESMQWRDEAMMKEEMGKMKEKKMRTMFFQNFEIKE